jgi:hypothetical protein
MPSSVEVSGLHGCITRGESSFIVKTSVMSFGVPPTAGIQKLENKILQHFCKKHNVPDFDHCNVPALLYSMTSNPKNYDELGKALRLRSRAFPGQEKHSCDIFTPITHSCSFLIKVCR